MKKKNTITITLDPETVKDAEACIDQVNRHEGNFLESRIDTDDPLIIELSNENHKPLTS